MNLVRERVAARVSTELEDSLWHRLSELYEPLVTDVALGMRATLELEKRPVRAGGELYRAASGDLLYYLVGPDRKSIEIGSISLNGNEAYGDFRSSVDVVLGDRKWTPVSSLSERFQLLREEAQAFHATPQDFEAAQLLSQPRTRQLLAEVRKRPGTLLSAVPTERPGSEVAEEANQLDRMGLIDRTFEVFCRDTGNKLLRTESYDALVEASSRGFKNFMSGRPILEERVEQLLSLTERGRRLSRPNIWLSYLVARTLLECGVSESDMLFMSEKECAILDLFAAYQGALFLFEVQQDQVTPDQAFRFLSRARYFRPEASFLVCPVRLNRDAMQVLLRTEGATFVVDDLSTLPDRLREVMQRSTEANVEQVLARFRELTELRVAELVAEHLLGPAPEAPVVEPEEPELEPEVEAAAPVAPEPPSVALAAGETTQEELDLLVDELLEGVREEEEAALAEAEEPVYAVSEDLEPMGHELADSGYQELGEELEEPVGEPVYEEPATSLSEAQADEEMFAEELVPDVSMPEHEHGLEERLEQMTRTLLDDLALNGLRARVKEVEDMLAEVAEVEGCSAAVVSYEGLLVAGRLETCEDPELAAAVQTDLLQAFGRAAEEGELGGLYALSFEGGASRLSVYPALDDLNLLIHEVSGGRDESEMDAASSLPGEMVLREAILKKVMEDLGRLEGVQGNLVTSRDGLPIDFQVEDESLNLEVLGVVLTQALVDTEFVLDRIGMFPARQYLLRTDLRWYSVIPLDREAVMITLLAPDLPRDIWNTKLTGAAQMLASVFQ